METTLILSGKKKKKKKLKSLANWLQLVRTAAFVTFKDFRQIFVLHINKIILCATWTIQLCTFKYNKQDLKHG